MNMCPLCGSKVMYHGLNTIECAGRDCENGRPITTAATYRNVLGGFNVSWFAPCGGSDAPPCPHDCPHLPAARKQ